MIEGVLSICILCITISFRHPLDTPVFYPLRIKRSWPLGIISFSQDVAVNIKDKYDCLALCFGLELFGTSFGFQHALTQHYIRQSKNVETVHDRILFSNSVFQYRQDMPHAVNNYSANDMFEEICMYCIST